MSTAIIIGCWFIAFLGLLLRDVLHKRELRGETPKKYLNHQYDYELGRASGSLLMPPDYAKVFGSKSVPFR